MALVPSYQENTVSGDIDMPWQHSVDVVDEGIAKSEEEPDCRIADLRNKRTKCDREVDARNGRERPIRIGQANLSWP